MVGMIRILLPEIGLYSGEKQVVERFYKELRVNKMIAGADGNGYGKENGCDSFSGVGPVWLFDAANDYSRRPETGKSNRIC
jgi:hypothetical protein